MTPPAPLTSTEGLKVGDVLKVSIRLVDRHRRGETFWWTIFRVVTYLPPRGQSSRGRLIETLILKLDPDMDKDIRVIDLRAEDTVATLLPEPWPQGVSAMVMKLLAKGVISIG